jgi:serine/threonine-protein kinase
LTIGVIALRQPVGPLPSLGAVVADTNTVTPTAPVPTTGPQAEQDALAQLQGQVTADHAKVEALVGSWVPEVSAKKLGVVVGPVVYDYVQIWSDHRGLVLRYPGALLLKSGDYTTFGRSGYWITVVPQRFSTAAAANAWCDSENIGPSDCLAARLTHDPHLHGNTVTR